MFNFRSFRTRLLILLVASKIASASILETFVKNIFAFGATGDRQGEPLRQVSRSLSFFTERMLAPGLQFLPADYRAVNSGTSIDFSYFTTHVCRRSK